jgi:hypothetical protein
MVAHLAGVARDKGVSGYLADGSNHWPSAHRRDRCCTAGAHFGFLAGFLGPNMLASNALTRELPGRRLTHPGFIDDPDHGHYDT